MKGNWCACFSFVLFVLLIFVSDCAASNFEYWNRESAEWKFHRNFKLSLDEELKFSGNGKGFYQWFTDPGLSFSPFKWISFGINYRFILEKNKKKHWETGSQPHMNVKLKASLYIFQLANCNRFEYRDRKVGVDGWRYRNKSTIRLLPKTTRFQLQPFASEEFFVDFKKNEVNRNRIYGGVNFRLFKRLKGEVYYFWEACHTKRNWKSRNVLGSKLKLTF